MWRIWSVGKPTLALQTVFSLLPWYLIRCQGRENLPGVNLRILPDSKTQVDGNWLLVVVECGKEGGIMYQLLVLVSVLIVSAFGNAVAFELNTQQQIEKGNSHVGLSPGVGDGRQGGEDMESAVVIVELPFSDTGNTSDNLDDYDAVCPYNTPTSPDVVYRYQPLEDAAIFVDLCGSGYDTKTYIFDESGNVVACNDDFYFDDTCGVYVSKIEDAFLYAGEVYYLVIDGYGGDSGDYILMVDTFVPPEPYILDCEGIPEGEPPLVDGYQDEFNGGCNSPEFGTPFQALDGDANGQLEFCGIAGWYEVDGANLRDTDWFTAIIGPLGMLEWTLDAEQDTYGFWLPNDCDLPAVIDMILVGPYAPDTMTIQRDPGNIVWLWVGSALFSPPAGFIGNEYNYISTFTGLAQGTVSTERTTFGGIKSLYRQ